MKIPTILVLGKNNFKRKDRGIYTYTIPSDTYSKNIDVAIAIWSAKIFRCTSNVKLEIKSLDQAGEPIINRKLSYVLTPTTTVTDLIYSIARDTAGDNVVEFVYDGKEIKINSFVDSLYMEFSPSLLKFLNQHSSDEPLIIEKNEQGTIHTFTNVWNGDILYLHSNLSSAPYDYVTDMPYLADKYIPRYTTSRSSDFMIWFTDDAENNIVDLIDETFIVELWLSKVDD